MKDLDEQALNRWLEYERDPENTDAQTRLLAALKDSPALRASIAEDRSIEGLIRVGARLARGDDFLEQALSRFTQAADATPVIETIRRPQSNDRSSSRKRVKWFWLSVASVVLVVGGLWFTWPRGLEKPPTKSMADETTFAMATWVSPKRYVQTKRIGTEVLEVQRGTLQLEMDNGDVVFVGAPARLHLESPTVWVIEKGDLIGQTSKTANLEIRGPQVWFAPGSSSIFHVRVTPKQTEIWMQAGEGRVNLLEGDSHSELRLTSGELNQALVAALPTRQMPAPQVLMTQGNGKFRGQLNVGNASLSLESPGQFENIANVVAELAKSNTVEPNSMEVAEELVESFGDGQVEGTIEIAGESKRFDNLEGLTTLAQQLPGVNVSPPDSNNLQKSSDDSNLKPTGMEIRVNSHGKQQSFQSLDDFMAFQQKCFGQLADRIQQNMRPGIQQRFDGEMNLNGQSFRFSDPQAFERARREMGW